MCELTSEEKYAAWKGSLDETFLLKITGVAKLDQIEDLRLCGLELCDDDLRPDVLNKLSSLVELNLSGNRLTCIPEGIVLKKLQYLDISNNRVASVEWVKRFPGLIDLDIFGNIGLTVDDRYKITFLLENLNRLDRKGLEESDKLRETFTKKLIVRINNLWKKEFADNIPDDSTEKDVLKLQNEFVQRAKAKVHYGPNSLKGYRLWRIEAIAKELVLFKIECPGSNLLLEIVDDTSSSEENPAVKSEKKLTRKAKNRHTEETCGDVFSPFSFLQCHSKDNGSSDFSTQVWCCSFEPDIEEKSKTTNLVATCGGDTVCITECTTAKVQMRFQQKNEEFYVVAWSTLNINKHKSNILVAAGCLGFIHLLHPKQGLCYGRINAHSSPIQTVMFSPYCPTHLLTGDKKGNVYMIDIDVPTIPEYKFSWKKLMRFVGIDATPLKFCIPPIGGYLLCASEYGLYCWKSNDIMKTFPRGRSSVIINDNLSELRFPGTKMEESMVDALAMLTDDMLATKVSQQGCIFLWKFSDVEPKLKATKGNKVSVITVPVFKELKWSNTKQCFINMAACVPKCSIISGDEVGNIWIYNLSDALEETSSYKAKKSKAIVPDKITEPSRIIPFPKCTNTSGDLLLKFKKGTIYNDISCNSDMTFIVVTADTNLVGIYKKVE
nr:leucine-rich repeat and WD repeat-containing protein 1-like [Ciona intestinalis]|eukprot:XP_009859337.1 leucine-rich repeat and WD repeat-containing protein 1-like [Ciona intestinalis]